MNRCSVSLAALATVLATSFASTRAAAAPGAEQVVPGAELAVASALGEIRATALVLELLATAVRQDDARPRRRATSDAARPGSVLAIEQRVWAGEEGLRAPLFAP